MLRTLGSRLSVQLMPPSKRPLTNMRLNLTLFCAPAFVLSWRLEGRGLARREGEGEREREERGTRREGHAVALLPHEGDNLQATHNSVAEELFENANHKYPKTFTDIDSHRGGFRRHHGLVLEYA